MNGSCGAVCDAGPGYDFVTGLGSPRAVNLIAGVVAQPYIVPRAGLLLSEAGQPCVFLFL
jgi:hypothetical protein